ncbi:MAG: winged helix-turn-helix transcriptional regulator [Nitrososphaera sp.]|uniref:winged helix-turn-helix transcriptional regulator n=1 Tax=Nitrososphaera sp. TaxID=1971748 RepID=UPI003D6DAB5D
MQRSFFLSGWSEDVSGLLRVLGRRWTLQILSSLSANGTLRFVELKGILGVSGTVLSERLLELEHEGLVAKATMGYSLTSRAVELERLLRGVKG